MLVGLHHPPGQLWPVMPPFAAVSAPRPRRVEIDGSRRDTDFPNTDAHPNSQSCPTEGLRSGLFSRGSWVNQES